MAGGRRHLRSAVGHRARQVRRAEGEQRADDSGEVVLVPEDPGEREGDRALRQRLPIGDARRRSVHDDRVVRSEESDRPADHLDDREPPRSGVRFRGGLTRVGAIDQIAPGEDIRSVRFDGDRGYVVTFKKTDPLFVMDLFEPRRPKILGELKIPGFSTYIHRIDPEHLLSIGFDANDHGAFAYYDGVILQLFDVKSRIDPKLVHKEKIGTRGSSSEAATDHLAFNYLASEGLLAVPMTISSASTSRTSR